MAQALTFAEIFRKRRNRELFAFVLQMQNQFSEDIHVSRRSISLMSFWSDGDRFIGFLLHGRFI